MMARKITKIWLVTLLALLASSAMVLEVMAEPYLAVRTGYSCSTCHTNPGGGGQRNLFGNHFSQRELPANALGGAANWDGRIFERFSVGGNARGGLRQIDLEDRDDNSSFDIDRINLYVTVKLNDFVSLYIDEQVAPGSASNREAYVYFQNNGWFAKAGKIFLPFGWRLEDDSAFIRSVTGINFNTSDNGVEGGYSGGNWDVALAVSNGTAGVSEVDDGKQFSLRTAFIRPTWRLGFSSNFNDTDSGERSILGLFAGLRTGIVSWLLEYDRIDDKKFAAGFNGKQSVALLEANVEVLRGHNLKVSLESQTSEDDLFEDRFRYSAVWEYFPIAFTQLRAGFRLRDSDDPAAELNSDEAFLQLHVFF